MRKIFTREVLESSLQEALSLFRQKDSYLLDHRVMEVSISWKIASYLERILNEKLIPQGYSLDSLGLNLDIEYNKYWEWKKEVEWVGSVRPDIILHQRWPWNPCIFVIEIKKLNISKEDRKKVQAFINDPRYSYWFWACVGNLSWPVNIEIYPTAE
jgi:hypothetical protein